MRLIHAATAHAGDALADEALDADIDRELNQELNSLLASEAAATAGDEAADGDGDLTAHAGDAAAALAPGGAGSGMKRALEISQRRAQKRHAVEMLWHQYARNQH